MATNKGGGLSTDSRPCRFCRNVKTAAGRNPVCGITGMSLHADEFFWSSNDCINWKLKTVGKPRQGETIAEALF